MGPILSIIGLACIVAGLVSLFKPLPRFKLDTRRKSIGLMVVGVIVLALFGHPPQNGGPDGGPGGGQYAGAPQRPGAPQGGPQGMQAPQGGPQGMQAPQGGPQGGPQAGPQRGGAPFGDGAPTRMGGDTTPGGRMAPSLVALRLPASQLLFLAGIEEARTAFEANPATATQIRLERKDKICTVLQDRAVKGWIGKVAYLGIDDQGRGIASVDVGNGVVITTGAQANPDPVLNTVIERKSELFTALSKLKTGDIVEVNGSFLTGDIDCVEQQGADLRGAMTTPSFTFKFGTVGRL